METESWKHLFVVFRIDHKRIKTAEDVSNSSLTIKEIFNSDEEAIKETERLNNLNASKGSTYLWQAAKYYPAGRRET